MAPAPRSIPPVKMIKDRPPASRISGETSTRRFWRLYALIKVGFKIVNIKNTSTILTSTKYCYKLDKLNFFCFISLLPSYIIKCTTSCWEGLKSTGQSKNPLIRPSLKTITLLDKPRHSSRVSPITMIACPAAVISRTRR